MNTEASSIVQTSAIARQRLGLDFLAVRSASAALAAPLSAEDCVVQTMPDVSPTKWHLAHTSWFFEQFVLGPHSPGTYSPLHAGYADLFNSYYESVGPQFPRPKRGFLTRPSLAEVLDYRSEITALVGDLIATCDESVLRAIAPLISLGIHHEQQHQELILTDIKHVLAANPMMPIYRPAEVVQEDAAECAWVSFEEGLFAAGADLAQPDLSSRFTFDNEGPRHRVFLEPFELATRPITNGEFAEFIEDGGYRRHEFWLAMGWDLAKRRSWDAPLYWFPTKGSAQGWDQFTLHGPRRVNPNEAVCHLSYFEADAYARWAGARLPTEFEWERAVQSEVPPTVVPAENESDLHPAAARLVPASCFQQLTGAVWQWTSSSYAPYPGYQPAAGAVGEYNGKFMCNQYVLRGSSCVTPKGHARPTYRNFFPPEIRWQFSGLRLARRI
jgi:ergothioneine biosynthesis protein EgtB